MVRVASRIVCCLVHGWYSIINIFMHSLAYFQFQFNFLQAQYNDATSKELRKVVPNIEYAIMWSYEVWSELDAQIVKNC